VIVATLTVPNVGGLTPAPSTPPPPPPPLSAPPTPLAEFGCKVVASSAADPDAKDMGRAGHLACPPLPPLRHPSRLVLLLPGTRLTPADYTLLALTAARTGSYVLSLSWVNYGCRAASGVPCLIFVNVRSVCSRSRARLCHTSQVVGTRNRLVLVVGTRNRLVLVVGARNRILPFPTFLTFPRHDATHHHGSCHFLPS
jgi:hypothetical protein